MFENLSLPHLLMVVAVALLVFGPKRIPEIAGSMGKGIREFKKSIAEVGKDEPAPLPETSALRPAAVARDEAEITAETAGGGEPKRLLRP